MFVISFYGARCTPVACSVGTGGYRGCLCSEVRAEWVLVDTVVACVLMNGYWGVLIGYWVRRCMVRGGCLRVLVGTERVLGATLYGARWVPAGTGGY